MARILRSVNNMRYLIGYTLEGGQQADRRKIISVLDKFRASPIRRMETLSEIRTTNYDTSGKLHAAIQRELKRFRFTRGARIHIMVARVSGEITLERTDL